MKSKLIKLIGMILIGFIYIIAYALLFKYLGFSEELTYLMGLPIIALIFGGIKIYQTIKEKKRAPIDLITYSIFFLIMILILSLSINLIDKMLYSVIILITILILKLIFDKILKRS